MSCSVKKDPVTNDIIDVIDPVTGLRDSLYGAILNRITADPNIYIENDPFLKDLYDKKVLTSKTKEQVALGIWAKTHQYWINKKQASPFQSSSVTVLDKVASPAPTKSTAAPVAKPPVQPIAQPKPQVQKQIQAEPEKQTQPSAVDIFQYYGAKYEMVLEDGKAVDVLNLKRNASETNLKFLDRKGKILDAYNANPNVDPQNGKYFRNDPGVKTAIATPPPKAKTGTVIGNSYTFADRINIETPFKLNDQQAEALQMMADWINNPNEKLFTLKGYAGTGKTSIIKVLSTYIRFKKGLSTGILFSSPTHRANAVLKLNTENEAIVTLHKAFGLSPLIDLEEFSARDLQMGAKNEPKLNFGDTLIIDESSMINDSLFEFISAASKNLGVKVLFMGDPGQIKPPKQKTLSKAFDVQNNYELTKVERTGDNPLLAEATRLRNSSISDTNFSYETLENEKREGITFEDSQANFFEKAAEVFKSEEAKINPLLARIVSGTNANVASMNQSIRVAIYGDKAGNEYNVGELLMGYSNYKQDYRTGESLLINSGDYVVTSVSPLKKKVFLNIGKEVSYYELILKNALNPLDNPVKIDMLSKYNPDDVFNSIGETFEKIRMEAVNANKSGNKRRAAELFQSLRSFQDEFALPKPAFYGLDQYGRPAVKINKTLDYGYAHTVHKSQGGTYKYIFVDSRDFAKFSDLQLRNQLEYVAITRAQKHAYVLHSQKNISQENKPVVKQPEVIPQQPSEDTGTKSQLDILKSKFTFKSTDDIDDFDDVDIKKNDDVDLMIDYSQTEELFNSNPELANQVYSALGFQGNISLESNLKNTGKTEQELIEYLKQKYPEIKLDISNNPIWEQGDNIYNQEEYENKINYTLKAVDILLSDKAKQVFEKGKKNNWDLNKILTELQVPKEQKQIILDSGLTNREEIITDLLANYSYTIEINTAKEGPTRIETRYQLDENQYEPEEVEVYSKEDAFDEVWNEGILEPYTDEFNKEVEYRYTNRNDKPSQYYSGLTVPGGTNYTENEIATPAIIPFIKGHAQFATDKGIGWFRSDDKVSNFKESYKGELDNIPSDILEEMGYLSFKTRRILEVQSDLFQKGRDKKNLAVEKVGETYSPDAGILEDFEPSTDKTKNQFLQLLNKDNNWVTFFVKSIVQDSAKKGYEKVLFPSGDTASKIEGHTTLEQFKKEKEDRIKKLEEENNIIKQEVDEISNSSEDDFIRKNPRLGTYEVLKIKKLRVDNSPLGRYVQVGLNTKQVAKSVLNEYIKSMLSMYKNATEKNNKEINQLKQEIERVETEGFGALKPIYNFYENTVTNILKKQGYNPTQITDEYRNTWNEVTINQARDLAEVLLQKDEAGKIIGQANIRAMTVLVDAVNKKADTIPHEYAHHYIAWFRDTPIVQEGIKRFGSEEALVQAIGEQVVKQKGEAYNWWKKFTNWILNLLSDKQLLQVLTDSFLNRQDLKDFTYNQITPQQKQQAIQLYSQYLNNVKLDILKFDDVDIKKNDDIDFMFDYEIDSLQDKVYDVLNFDTRMKNSEQDLQADTIYSAYLQSKSNNFAIGSNEDIDAFEQFVNQPLNAYLLPRETLYKIADRKMDELLIAGEITFTNEENQPCAAFGGKTSFTPGSQWEMVKDLKGYPSHANGGVDLKFGKGGVGFMKDGGMIKAAHGLVLPAIVAKNGLTVPADFEDFKKFNITLPDNLRDDSFKYGDYSKYDLYGMWEASGKPKSFDDVKDTELFPKQDDGTYHGFSVGNDGIWLKPETHSTAFMELMQGELSPELQDQTVIRREDGRLQYVKRNKIKAADGLVVPEKPATTTVPDVKSLISIKNEEPIRQERIEPTRENPVKTTPVKNPKPTIVTSLTNTTNPTDPTNPKKPKLPKTDSLDIRMNPKYTMQRESTNVSTAQNPSKQVQDLVISQIPVYQEKIDKAKTKLTSDRSSSSIKMVEGYTSSLNESKLNFQYKPLPSAVKESEGTPCPEGQCAAYVGYELYRRGNIDNVEPKQFFRETGLGSQSSEIEDAWKIGNSVIKKGGSEVYNREKSKQKQATDVKPGDIVMMYTGGFSDYQQRANKEGDGNTHTGFVSKVNPDGSYYVTHNSHARNSDGTWRGRAYEDLVADGIVAGFGYKVNRIVRPNYENTKASSKKIVVNPDNVLTYSGNRPIASEIVSQINRNKETVARNFGLDENEHTALQKAALGIIEQETKFGEAFSNKLGLGSNFIAPAMNTYETLVQGHKMLRSAIHSDEEYGVNQEESQGIGRVKVNINYANKKGRVEELKRLAEGDERYFEYLLTLDILSDNYKRFKKKGYNDEEAIYRAITAHNSPRKAIDKSSKSFASNYEVDYANKILENAGQFKITNKQSEMSTAVDNLRRNPKVIENTSRIRSVFDKPKS